VPFSLGFSFTKKKKPYTLKQKEQTLHALYNAHYLLCQLSLFCNIVQGFLLPHSTVVVLWTHTHKDWCCFVFITRVFIGFCNLIVSFFFFLYWCAVHLTLPPWATPLCYLCLELACLGSEGMYGMVQWLMRNPCRSVGTPPPFFLSGKKRIGA
jgi:hypothetical protein